LKVGLERDIKELDRQIREARRAATAALTLEEKLDAQKRIKAIEAQRNTTRRALFDAQDDIDRRREQLIGEIEGKLEQKTTLLELFTIRWKLV
jgi:adenine-specific DNA-methyltransferase